MPRTETSGLCYRFVDHKWKQGGIVKKEKRLEFYDPSERLLKYQVQRWRPDNQVIKSNKPDQAETAQIRGIKVHNKAMHILFLILSFITCGQVKKSFAVVLGGKEVYLNLNSYNKWRRLNGEALTALGVVKNGTKQQIISTRRDEVKAIETLLVQELHKRPTLKPSINTSENPFEMISSALNFASLRIQNAPASFTPPAPATLEKMRYQLAACYILNSSKISDDCGSKYLSISESGRKTIDARVHLTSVKEVEDLQDKNDLSLYERKKLEATRIVITDDSNATQLLNIKPDPLSSPLHPNDPVTAKMLLNDLTKSNEHFLLYFNHLLVTASNVESQLSSPKEKEFFKHIERIGLALQDQFSHVHPLAQSSIFSILRTSYLQLGNQKLFDEDSATSLGPIVTTLAALNLMKSAEVDYFEDQMPKSISFYTDDNNSFSIPMLPVTQYVDMKTNKPIDLSPTTSLTGFLQGEQGNISLAPSTWTLLEISGDVKSLDPLKMSILEELLRARAFEMYPFKDEPLPIEKLTAQFWTQLNTVNSAINKKLNSFGQIDQSEFKLLVKLCERIEKVGALIHSRYWDKAEPKLQSLIEFSDNGKIKKINGEINQPKVRRPKQTHDEMIRKYLPSFLFPSFNVPYPAVRPEPPRIKPEELDAQLSAPEMFHLLYENPRNDNPPDGSCCVKALAHSVWPHYFDHSGTFNSPQVYVPGSLLYPGSGNQQNYQLTENILIASIRKAVSQYMKDNPEQFFDLVENSGRSPKEAVLNRAGEIYQSFSYHSHNDRFWFTKAELTAFSHIIGRPIHVVHQNGMAIEKFSKTLKMHEMINDELDAEPIVLVLAMFHYTTAFPKRVGSKDKNKNPQAYNY